MKRMVLVLGTLLGTLLMVAPPTSAQIAVGGLAEVEGVPPPPEYVLAADGTLTMGGDTVLNCNEVARSVEQHGDDPPSDPYLRDQLKQAEGVVEECERIGFSYSGGTVAGPIESSGVEDAEGTPVGGVTEDGFVRTQYNTFVACGSGFPVVEQYAQACGSAGLPPADAPVSEVEDGSAGAIAIGPGASAVPDPPDYALNDDGIVVVDGDSGSDCRTFALERQEGYFYTGDQEQAQGVLEQCERRGLLPSGDRYAANTPAGGQQPPVTQAELPATGGPGLSIPEVPLAGGVLLTVLTVLGIVARRRTS